MQEDTTPNDMHYFILQDAFKEEWLIWCDTDRIDAIDIVDWSL